MGNTSATAVRASVNADGARLTTLECVIPRVLLANFLDYPELVVSKSLHDGADEIMSTIGIEHVDTSHAISPFVRRRLDEEFGDYEKEATAFAKRVRGLYPEDPGPAAINHIMYPFTFSRVLISATEWGGFFNREIERRGFDAPMKTLATLMKAAHGAAEVCQIPEGGAHLPYIVGEDLEAVAEFIAKGDAGLVSEAQLAFAQMLLRKISVARCARVSGVNARGQRPAVKQDLALYEAVVSEQMLCPAAHVALPDRVVDFTETGTGPAAWVDAIEHERYVGWRPYSRHLKNVWSGKYPPTTQPATAEGRAA